MLEGFAGERMGIGAVADGVPEVLKATRLNLRNGATQIKIMGGGGVMSEFDPIHSLQPSPAEIRAAVQAAADWGTYVLAHAYTSEAVARLVENGVKSIEHGLLIFSFTVLTISGIPQKWPDSFWGNAMIQMMGGIEWTRVIHHTAAVILILEALYHLGPLSLGELAGKLLVTGGNVTYVMDRLEEHGWVIRERCGEDRRVVRAKLTPAGRRDSFDFFGRSVAVSGDTVVIGSNVTLPISKKL